MFSSTEQIGLTRWRILAAIVTLALIDWVGEPIWFRVTHKAPLGRTAADVTQALSRELPPGTRVDSAESHLRRLGIDVSYKPGDSTLIGVEHNVAGGFVVTTDIAFRSVVDPQGHIGQWTSNTWRTGP